MGAAGLIATVGVRDICRITIDAVKLRSALWLLRTNESEGEGKGNNVNTVRSSRDETTLWATMSVCMSVGLLTAYLFGLFGLLGAPSGLLNGP